MTDLGIRIAELRQLCANPSDGLTGGDWCQAANEAVEIILSLEEQYAEAARLLALVTRIAKQQTKWEPGLGYVAIGEADAFLNAMEQVDG